MIMTIGERILKYLERKEIPVKTLADQIEVDVNSLQNMLANNSLEIKTLEKISKELRIPLYSFFTSASFEDIVRRNKFEIPYYIERLEPDERSEFKYLMSNMMEQIEQLKMQLLEKDIQLEHLKRMLEKHRPKD